SSGLRMASDVGMALSAADVQATSLQAAAATGRAAAAATQDSSTPPVSNIANAANLPAGPTLASFPGTASTFALGSFSTGAGFYTASVHWGDGSPDSAGIVARSVSGYIVLATHTYSQAGASGAPYVATATVTGAGGAQTFHDLVSVGAQREV